VDWCLYRLTMSAGRSMGTSRRMTALTRLKMAVLAPMPRARERTATAVKVGRLVRERRPSRRSRHTAVNVGIARVDEFGVVPVPRSETDLDTAGDLDDSSDRTGWSSRSRGRKT